MLLTLYFNILHFGQNLIGWLIVWLSLWALVLSSSYVMAVLVLLVLAIRRLSIFL